MNIEILFDGKPMTIQLTPAAETALCQLTLPLVAELELYFSCMIRKRVHFHTTIDSDRTVKATENLHIRFHPVMTERCSLDASEEGVSQLTDFPIVKPGAYVPHWVRIDHRKGEWVGEFGYL